MKSIEKSIILVATFILAWALVAHNLCIPRPTKTTAIASASPQPVAPAPASGPAPTQPAAPAEIAVSGATSASSSTPSSGGSPLSEAKQGSASFYTEWSSNPGSCGFIPTNEDIAAINPMYMPSKCNQCIMINYEGKSLKVKVTDTCPGCTETKIDLSDRAFAKLADKSKGIIKITWAFVPC